MRTPLLALLAVLILLPTPASAQPESECIPYLRGKLREMASGAEQCGVSAAQMRTFPEINPEVNFGCSQPIGARLNQLQSFQQCARVYICAGKSYQCAIQAKNAGADCRSAMNSCFEKFPVPK